MTDYSKLTTDQLIDALTDDANVFTSRREVADALRARVQELEEAEWQQRSIEWLK